ncbi:MAG: hypothetical protein FJX55_05615, partial [Alphaproteobacteria bacterium]|nr:hypothetical protein [Alphaproteobacteria bacterium]
MGVFCPAQAALSSRFTPRVGRRILGAMLRRLAWLVIAAIAVLPLAAHADQKDGSLDELFAKLR